MRNQRDIIVWKLGNDLCRARLALGKIYNIAMKVYCHEAKHAMNSIHRDDVDKIVETLQEYFDDDKRNSNH